MADVVAYAGQDRPPRRLSISFDLQRGNFPLDFEPLRAKAVGPVDDACWDFLEIASAVFAADALIPRGAATRPGLGAGWRRVFEFSIPVVRTDVWEREEVVEALIDAVSFLTDDTVRFSFKPKKASPNRQYPLIDDDTATPFPAAEVILFSGGLDSLTGAMERLSSGSDRVVLVTHRSAQKAIPRQQLLGLDMSKTFGGRVLHAHFRATRARVRASDTTQRSRSFLFAALGYAHARVFGAPRISFFENGTISHNLPISPQVIGTMATRTTHPLALQKLARVLDLLADALGHPRILLSNPYEWLTKSEVVERLHACGGSRLIRHAVSCTSLRKQSKEVTHCGACSQCLDRRFAIVSAGLEQHDPASAYLTDVFIGERGSDRSRTLALDWTRQAWEAADVTPLAFLTEMAGELERIMRGYSGLSREDAAKKAFDLHRRHGAASRRALSRMLAAHAGDVLAHKLPETSLLQMAIRERLGVAAPAFPALALMAPTVEPVRPLEDKSMNLDVLPLQVAFTIEGGRRFVDVMYLATLTGSAAALAHRLKDAFDEDRAAQRPRDQHRYIPPGFLHKAGKAAVKTCVGRIRGTLAKAYQDLEGRPPVEHLLVQSKSPRGYRLDPTIHLVAQASGNTTRHRRS